MHKYKCITVCYHDSKLYTVGEVVQATELPCRHFVLIEEEKPVPVKKEVKKKKNKKG